MPEEDAALVSFLEKQLSAAAISVKLRRSQAAVYSRAMHLGVPLSKKRKRPKMLVNPR
jgi:hypothetical protein